MNPNFSLASPGTLDFAKNIVQAVANVIGPAEKLIALHEPNFSCNELLYVKECIETGWVSSVGAFVDRFERDLVAFTGANYAVATVNGTAALHMCLLLAGVEQGDEVLAPALTFVATANAISYTGATPHFVDSEAISLGVDADRLDLYLDEIAEVVNGVCINRRTGSPIRALVVTHIFGHPANLDKLDALAKRWRLHLIEDAAESLGSFYHQRHTGNVGLLSALSFNGNKIVTTGGGGAVLTNDVDLAKRAKHLTTTARVPHRWGFMHDEVGYNYRLPNLNAALGCAQLEHLAEMIEKKRNLASRYAQAFLTVPGLRFLSEPEGARSNYWLNSLVLQPADEDCRDHVLTALNDAGYMARPLWTLMHQLPMYSTCPRMDLYEAERLAMGVISLPSSAALG